MKKIFAMLMVLCMAMTCMVAMADEAPLTVTIMAPDFKADKDWMTLEAGNPILQYILEETGVAVEMIWVPNSVYGDTLSTTLADTANLPDIIVMTGPRDAITINTARSGAFWDLTDLIPEYEYLSQGSDVAYTNISVDGRIYGIYRTRATARNGIYYRYDVAVAAGYPEVPTTVEEFTEMSYGMLDYIKATYGETAYLLNCCSYIAGTMNDLATIMGAPNEWMIAEDGTAVPAFETEGYQLALDWLRDLYAAGGINPDFITIPTSDWDTIERTDKCFMRIDCLDNAYRQQEYFTKTVENGGRGLEDTRYFQPLPNMINQNGDIMMLPTQGFNGELCVTKHVSAENLDTVLSFLDWCNSYDGQSVISNGQEGLTYILDENGFRVTVFEGQDADKADAIHHSLNQIGMNVQGDITTPLASASSTYRMEYNQGLVDNLQYCVANPVYSLTSDTAALVGSTLTTAVQDKQVQYIAGLIDLDELQAAYADWHANGGDAIIDEYTEQYAQYFG